MPNNKNERKGKQAGELSSEERFRNFFSTSVIDLPEEMTRRDEPAPVEEKPKAGLLGKLFGHDKEETSAPAQPVLEIPTGEILLGADAKPVQPEQEDMALELRTADPIPAMPLQPARVEPAKAVPAEPVPAPKAAAVQPEPEKPAPQPVPQPVAAPKKQPKAKNAPEILLPQEELEQREMQQLKDMLNGMSGKAKPAPQPVKPVQTALQPKVQPAPAQPAAEPEKAPAKAAQKAAEELPPVVFASAPADPETLPKKPEKKSIFQMFGTAEDEKPAARKLEKEDTMSLPLLPLEEEGAPAEAAETQTPEAPAQRRFFRGRLLYRLRLRFCDACHSVEHILQLLHLLLLQLFLWQQFFRRIFGIGCLLGCRCVLPQRLRLRHRFFRLHDRGRGRLCLGGCRLQRHCCSGGLGTQLQRHILLVRLHRLCICTQQDLSGGDLQHRGCARSGFFFPAVTEQLAQQPSLGLFIHRSRHIPAGHLLRQVDHTGTEKVAKPFFGRKLLSRFALAFIFIVRHSCPSHCSGWSLPFLILFILLRRAATGSRTG